MKLGYVVLLKDKTKCLRELHNKYNSITTTLSNDFINIKIYPDKEEANDGISRYCARVEKYKKEDFIIREIGIKEV